MVSMQHGGGKKEKQPKLKNDFTFYLYHRHFSVVILILFLLPPVVEVPLPLYAAI